MKRDVEASVVLWFEVVRKDVRRSVVWVGRSWGACSDQEEMQQMERLLFEEFRGQQELDSARRNRLDCVFVGINY